MTSTPRIAIIGAGVAGLACGKTLRTAGLSPVIFEKSRGLGGRMATRWTRDGLFFDHGAQYVTARAPEFSNYVADAQASGRAVTWEREPGAAIRSDRYVGTPGMKDLATPMAEGLDVRLETRVTSMQSADGRWAVETETDATETFDYVVCAMPAPQTLDLLPPNSLLAKPVAEVELAPCWALMIAFDQALAPSFDSQRFDSGPIAWVARNSAKPGRSRTPETWVLHASPTWSETHLELNAKDIQARLLKAFAEIITHPLPPTSYLTAHRWRYALTTKPFGQPFASSEDKTLFVCGDWCLGARVEAAYQSGQAAGHALCEAVA